VAKDAVMEADRRLDTDKLTVQQSLQAVQEELAAEYLDRRNAEAALAKAPEGRQKAHGGLRDAVAARIVLWPCKSSVTRRVVVEPRCTACNGADVSTPLRNCMLTGRFPRSGRRERRWLLRIRPSTLQARRRGP
jgi:hypothetical protein